MGVVLKNNKKEYENFRYNGMHEKMSEREFTIRSIVMFLFVIAFGVGFYYLMDNILFERNASDVSDSIEGIELKSFDNSVCIESLDNAVVYDYIFSLEYTLKINKDDFNMDCYNELKNEIDVTIIKNFMGNKIKADYLVLNINKNTYKFKLANEVILLDDDIVKNLLNDDFVKNLLTPVDNTDK